MHDNAASNYTKQDDVIEIKKQAIHKEESRKKIEIKINRDE